MPPAAAVPEASTGLWAWLPGLSIPNDSSDGHYPRASMATKPQVACGWMHTTHKSTGAQRPHESKQPSRLANHVSRAVAYLGQQQYVYANIATIKMQRAAICSGALVDCQSTGALMKRCISLAANASARSHVYVHARCFATTMDSASVGILYHNPSKHTLRPRMRYGIDG